MTRGNDHDEDMSMEEILASIRRFVTDQPPEKSVTQKISPSGPSTGARSYSTAQQINNTPENPSLAPSPFRQPASAYHNDENQTSDLSQAQPVAASSLQSQENFSLPGQSDNFTNSAVQDRPYESTRKYAGDARVPNSSFSLRDNHDASILTLTNPINPDKPDRPVSPLAKTASGGEETIGSAHTLVSSAGSLARLAQTAKSVPGGKAPIDSPHQRNITLDQLIQDMIRPMIKQWIDTHLPSLVEEMVAKEIKRITRHLE